MLRYNHMGTEEVAAARIPRIEVAAHMLLELPHILLETDMLVRLEVVVILLLAGTPWLQQP